MCAGETQTHVTHEERFHSPLLPPAGQILEYTPQFLPTSPLFIKLVSKFFHIITTIIPFSESIL